MHQSNAAGRGRPPPSLQGLEAVRAAAAEAVADVDLKFAAVRQTVSAMLRSGSRSLVDIHAAAALLRLSVGPAGRAGRRLSLPLGLYYAEAPASLGAAPAAAAAAAREDAESESLEARLLSGAGPAGRGQGDTLRTQSPARSTDSPRQRRESLAHGRRQRMSPPRGPPLRGGERGRTGRPGGLTRDEAVTPEAVRDGLIRAGILLDSDG